MALILVVPAARLDALVRDHAPSHWVEIVSPDGAVLRSGPPARVWEREPPTSCVLRDELPRSSPRHDARTERIPTRPTTLRLTFHDIAAPCRDLVAPSPDDVARLLAFARSWDGARPLAVSCALGISRSPAAAFAIGCALRPDRPERELARRLREAAPCATPNPLLVALADAALGRSGRMIAAVETIGRGTDYVPQPGFALALGRAGGSGIACAVAAR